MKYKIRRSAAGLHVQAAPTDKIGFYGAAPVAQQAAIVKGTANSATTDAIIDVLTNLGLISKALILFLGLVALFAASTVPVQAYVDTQNLATTNTVPASSTVTSNVGNALDVSNHDAISVILTFTGLGPSTGNVTLTFARSATGSTYETTPQFAFSVAANGTNTVTIVTNFTATTIGAASWIQPVSLQNAATNGITNITVQVNRKHIY